MITNKFNQFKFTFDASIAHSLTVPIICDLTADTGRRGYPTFPAHYFSNVVCSVTVWDEEGGYWMVEGGASDMSEPGHGTSDYEWDIKVNAPGIIYVYTNCPLGIIMVNGVELTEMGPARSGA